MLSQSILRQPPVNLQLSDNNDNDDNNDDDDDNNDNDDNNDDGDNDNNDDGDDDGDGEKDDDAIHLKDYNKGVTKSLILHKNEDQRRK
jgi:hypothetical protein